MTVGSRAGGFRGLAPFEAADAALWRGRRNLAAELLERLGAERTPLLLTGEAGSGKTSFVLGELLPAARQARLSPVYLEGALDWRWQFRQQIARLEGQPPGPQAEPHRVLVEHLAARQTKPLLVLDHVESLLWLAPGQLDPLRQLVGRLRALADCRLLVAVDLGYLHALEPLSSELGGLAEAQVSTLERLGPEAASELIEQTVLGGGGTMEDGLAQEIASELCATDPVLPATLQVVGHAAALQGATRAKTYHRAGGARVLARTYVPTLVRRAGGWRTRRLISVFADQPNPRALLHFDEVARLAGLTEDEARGKLDALVRVGLLRVLSSEEVLPPAPDPEQQTPDPGQQAPDPGQQAPDPGQQAPDPGQQAPDPGQQAPDSPADETPRGPRGERQEGYSLLHPYLHQPIRDCSAPVRRGRARAGLYLRRRAVGRQLLRPHELLDVYRFIGEALEGDQRLKVQRSSAIWLAALAGLAALPLLALLLLHDALDSNTYVDRAAAVPGVQRVVLRQGDPDLRFAFGLSHRFGALRSDSGIALASLPEAQARAVQQHRIVEPVATPGQAEHWFARLVEPLEPVRRAAWLALAGDPRGRDLLLQAAAQPASRKRATEMIVLLFGDLPLTDKALRQCLADPRAEIRRLALQEARRIGSDDRSLRLLRQGLDDADPQLRLFALEALGARGTKAAAAALVRGLRDPDSAVWRRALVLLQQLVKRDPHRSFALLVDTLLAPRGLPGPVAEALERSRGQLVRQHGAALAALLLRRLEATEATEARLTLLRWLHALPTLDPRPLLPLVDRLAGTEPLELRALAIALQSRLRGGPEQLAALETLARSVAPDEAAVIARQAAALGLASITGVRSDARLKPLKRLIRDRAAPVRRTAARSMIQAGGSALLELSRPLQRGRDEVVVDAALQAICDDPVPALDRRRARAVLVAIWRARKTPFKLRALGCAAALGALDDQLPGWLADRAAGDRDPAVRAAAADAVALALARGDGRSVRRARRYLRDDAATVRAAMLAALALRPPADARPLSGLVTRLRAAQQPPVRAGAARLLPHTAPQPEEAAAEIAQLLQDPQPAVRRAALEACRELPKTAADRVAPALTRLSDGRPADEALHAMACARALGLVAPLKRGARHVDAEVRGAAIAALAIVAPPTVAITALTSALRHPEQRTRLAAIEALGAQSQRLGPAAVRLIYHNTGADDPAQRAAAFRALIRQTGARAATAIPLLLADARAHSEARRRRALRALGQLAAGEARGRTALIAGALDEAYDVRAAAQEALARHLGQTAEPRELWRLLRHSEDNALVRRTMIAALAASGHHRQLEKWLAGLPATTTVVVRSAARLAHALARRGEPAGPLLGWLYGW